MKIRTLFSPLIALAMVLGSMLTPVYAAAAPNLRPWNYGFGTSSDETEGTQAMIDECGLEHLEYTSSENRTVPYWIYVPKNEDGTVPENLPLVVYMHGYGDGGGLGSDPDNKTALRLHNGVLYRLMQQRNEPDRQAIVLVPMTPQRNSLNDDLAHYYDRWVQVGNTSGASMNAAYWNVPTLDYDTMPRSANLKCVVEMIKSVQTQYKADTDRAYVAGMSMGGCATWDLISRDDEHLFAAAVPICGIGDPDRAVNASQTPIRTFHGTIDNTINVVSTKNMYAALRKYGNITFTEYPDEAHFSWNSAYSTELDDDNDGLKNIDDMIDWMFNQSRKGPINGKADLDPLKQMITLAETAESASYTTAAWNTLQTQKEAAQALVARENPDSEELKDACAKLDEALLDVKVSLCLNKPVTENAHHSSNVGTYAVDGSISTYWDSGVMSSASALTVDLESPKTLGIIKVTTYHGDNRHYKYQVYGSLDQSEWTLLAEKNDTAASTAAGTAHTLAAPARVRYLQLRPVYCSANNYFHLCELEAYAAEFDTDLLEQTIDKAETLSADDFDAANMEALQPLITSGRSVLDDPESQAQINARRDELHAALLALRRIPVSPLPF